MGSDANRLRKKWQDYSGEAAAGAEKNFFDVFTEIFKDTEYVIRTQPKEFKKHYVGYPLSEEVTSEIYNPPKKITMHGFAPDFAIDNTETKKQCMSSQKGKMDGWKVAHVRMDEEMHMNVLVNFLHQVYKKH